jgi:hypothetical protein
LTRTLAELPNVPAVYAMHGGEGRSYVAYVGVADALKRRVLQHLVLRDSSVTTGTTAVGLNPDHVRAVSWWEHPDFGDRVRLEAAELVAFDVLEPALRSRGGITAAARALSTDESFRTIMTAVFQGPPKGRVILPTLAQALERIAALEERVAALDASLHTTS